MGQMVSALMIGSKLLKKHERKDGDFLWTDSYPGEEPRLDETGKFFGFFYAVSAGEKNGCALMVEALPLPNIESAFPKERKAAQKKWDEFSQWYQENYGEGNEPTPYTILTRTEVA